MINEREDAITRAFRLDPLNVQRRSVASARFEHMVSGLTPESFVTIFARNDAEGRWLYPVSYTHLTLPTNREV